MLGQAEPKLQSGDEYSKLLLRERRRELGSLARGYTRHQITSRE